LDIKGMLVRNGLQKKNRLKIGKHFTGGWKLKIKLDTVIFIQVSYKIRAKKLHLITRPPF